MLGDRATFRDNGNPYARVPPSGGVSFQNCARNPVLVNERLSAPCYRPQTLASNLAKSQRFFTIYGERRSGTWYAQESRSVSPYRSAGIKPVRYLTAIISSASRTWPRHY